MKKMILGITLFVSGFFGAIVLIISTVLSPLNSWNYNGITGWLGVALGMELQMPLIICSVIAVMGAVCIIESLRTK